MQKAIDETKKDIEMRENEYKKIKHIQELSDELMNFVWDFSDKELPWILEARVIKNCFLDKQTANEIKQLAIEIEEETDDSGVVNNVKEILSLLQID